MPNAARGEVRLGLQESLDVGDRECGELLAAEAWNEMEPGDVLVPLVRLEPEPALLGREPRPEPLLYSQALAPRFGPAAPASARATASLAWASFWVAA